MRNVHPQRMVLLLWSSVTLKVVDGNVKSNNEITMNENELP